MATVLAALATTPLAHADDDRLVARARAAAERRDARGVVDALAERYKALAGFSSEGEIVSHMTVAGNRMRITTRFTAAAARPERYRVTWSTSPPAPPGEQPSGERRDGATWNAGDGPGLYLNPPPRWAREASDEVALGAATGISNGAAAIVASFLVEGQPFPGLSKPTFEGEEQVDGERCWVVSGSSPTSKKETLWISPERLLVRRHRRLLAMSPEALKSLRVPQGKELDEALAQAGVPPTEENRRRMAAGMEMAREFAKRAEGFDGDTTATFHTVRPDVQGVDFAFAPPAGTRRVDSVVSEYFESPPPGARK